VVPIIRKGKKFERILSMAPLFKLGRVKILKEQVDFINEWVDYASDVRNPKDDCLDSMEITLSLAGVLLPHMAIPKSSGYVDLTDNSIEGLRNRDLPVHGKEFAGMDEHLGADW
jgi:hypothetical protein